MENIYPGPYFFMPFMQSTKNIKEDMHDMALQGELFSPDLTLLHGNEYKKEYVPYKNYTPSMPFSKNAKEEMLLEIQMYTLAMHDLKLHLDIYPNDEEIYNLYKKYCEKIRSLEKEYKDKYEPQHCCDAKYENGFTWVEMMKRY